MQSDTLSKVTYFCTRLHAIFRAIVADDIIDAGALFLQYLQFIESPFLRHQLVIAALLGDVTMFNHGDEVSGLEGGEAVRNKEGRAAAHQAGGGIGDKAFCLGVEGTGSLVKDNQPRAADERPGNRYALALPT